MAGVKIPVQAQFDASDVDKVLAELTQEVNKLGSTVAGANRVKFNPIDKASMADLQKLQAQFDSLLKVSNDFKKRMKDTGQAGTDFFKVDFDKMYPDPNSRARQMRKAYEYVTAGTGASFSALPSPPGSGGRIGTDDTAGKREWDRRQGGGSGGGNGGGGGNGSPASSWGSAGRKILGSGLRSMGGAGGAAAGAMDGLAGGIGGPLILANLIAQGVSAVVGMVKAKIGDAQQLDIGYDTLKRQLGDVGVGFNDLKTSLSNASWGFSATYEETLKVAEAFSRAAGTFGKDSKTLAGEVEIAGGFARSYGIDPSRSGAFFGQMRQSGVTSDENSSKRLALMIGETVAKSGASSKMDEVLAAIAGFSQQQARIGMAPANVSGFLGEFAGMANSGPGTDPQSIMNLLSTVNGAIQRGGNAGDGGRNFMYASLGKRNGLDPIMTGALEEQGMFGTMGGAFGDKSAMARFGAQYHVRMPTLGASSGQTNFSSIMASLKTQYARNPELMLSAMSNMFGIGLNQSAALATANPQSVGGAASRLSRLHLDFAKVNATGIQRLSDIEADKGLSDVQKDQQFKAVYDKNQQATQGSEIRDGLTGVSKVITDMADKMVPLTTTIMNSVVFMAGGGKRSQRQIVEANADAEHTDRQAQIDAGIKQRSDAARKDFAKRGGDLLKESRQYSGTPRGAAAQAEYNRLRALVDGQGSDPQSVQENALEQQRWSAEKSQADASISSPGTQSLKDADWLKAAASETDKLDKLPAGTTMAQFERESKFDPTAVSSAGAMGMAQVMPDTLVSLQKQLGRKLNPYDPHDAVVIQRELMRQNMAKFNNLPDALRAYNKGWDPSKWNNPETQSYAPAIMGRTSAFASVPSDKVPAELKNSQAKADARGEAEYWNAKTPQDRAATAAALGYTPSISSARVPATDAASKPGNNGDNRKQWFAFEHNITLQYPNGQPAAPLAQVTKEVGPPRPAGT
jgi:soluble lytic murein transglycosylase-like protein